jgi:hypothetical protein
MDISMQNVYQGVLSGEALVREKKAGMQQRERLKCAAVIIEAA